MTTRFMDIRLNMMETSPDRIISVNKDTLVSSYHRDYGITVRTGNVLIRCDLYDGTIGELFDNYDRVEEYKHHGISVEHDCFSMFYAAGII